MTDIFTLLILFQLKHFFCDYPLQNKYMLGKFKREGWVFPLAAHSLVHGTTTTVLAYLFTGNITLSFVLGLVDTSIHFIVDRLKAHPDIGGKYTTEEATFWHLLGMDQMAHHLTHYLLIYVIITS